jgi:Rieske Fe-S protein
MFRIIILFCLTLTITSCDKDGYDFPFTPVNLYLYPNNAEYNNLHFPGGTAYVEGGINGILIFHDYFDNYIAYDRACTNDPLNSCEQVYIDEENTNNLLCHCCDSKYFIYDGAVTQGPANYALHRYKTTFDGVTLRIYN